MTTVSVAFFFILSFVYFKEKKNLNTSKFVFLFFLKYFLRFNAHISDGLLFSFFIRIIQMTKRKLLTRLNDLFSWCTAEISYLNNLIKKFCNVFLTLICPKTNKHKISKTLICFPELYTYKFLKKKYCLKDVFLNTLSTKDQTSVLKKNLQKFLSLKKICDQEFSVVNFSLFFEKFNRILYLHNIKGFTQTGFKFMINVINSYSKYIGLELCKFAIQRQSHKNLKKEQWGRENFFSEVKVKKFKKINSFINYENLAIKSLFYFRRIKKRLFLSDNKKYFNAKIDPKKEINLDFKYRTYAKALKKVNKTLVILLTEILQKRIFILKEMTKCLLPYKPSVFNSNKDKIVSIYPKKNLKNLEKKKKNGAKKKWCTSKDCMKFLKTGKHDFDFKYFFKWFLHISSDYNSQKLDCCKKKIKAM
mmetsp:Transcript_58662/g.155135  ORF Transcript_58662/g.155135 Transcript_58662/m.155135 type:complete len:418 (-) Transcript_58662:6154-7407(-)